MENTTQATGLTFHTDSFWTSSETNLINSALVKFHGEGISIPKNGTATITSTVKRSYMKLDDILNHVRPALAKVGCYLDQHLAGDAVITRIVHESGQFISSKMNYQTWEGGQVNNLQKMGGGLSYLRRYAAAAILALPADEDADGEGTDNMGHKPATSMAAPAPRMTPNPKAESSPAKGGADTGLPWLNMTDKKGALTDAGQKATQFIEGGGKVADIQKKYRLNKTDLATLQKLEGDVANALEEIYHNQETHGELDHPPF